MQLEQLERPHFFAGRLLTVEDYQREQDYHRNRARLHNRFLHGWGVVTGLKVWLDGDAVVVSPGVAMDCMGNELVLPCEERISLSAFVGRKYVTVRYTELPCGQVPSSSGSVEPSHFREGLAIELSSSDPMAGHRGQRIGGPGCGASHGLCLATVDQRGARWRVTKAKLRVVCGR